MKPDKEQCKLCESKNCTYICPAQVYEWNEEKQEIIVNYENCLECGACRIACERKAIDWKYPKGTKGVTLNKDKFIVIYKGEKKMKEEYSQQHRRWYDKDPVLSEAVRTLEETDDQTQIRVALNLIKIIIEHNIEDEKFEAVDDIINAVGSGLDDNRRGRWYDIDTTLRTAMNMLQNCPEDTQKLSLKKWLKWLLMKLKKMTSKTKTVKNNF